MERSGNITHSILENLLLVFSSLVKSPRRSD